ncbi:MFS transporter [Spongiactinospora sp. TRM90649]|uniref:MFS transporter n=1 Tax=Spongiactinospora sp. TRM90649 TaxID=3031114 RepID=UPI0023F7EDA3|nr:MFS transporter [Spongiactinospora sp. TRM90649]MDF5757686.1 MFS transporter [Spongiactinospora sp. TRM90649]
MTGLLGRLVGLPDVPAVRRWAWVAVVDSLGTGLMLPLVIIYFTQMIKLSPVMVGLAMSIAGLVGVALVPVGGALVDRIGAKPVVIGAFVLASVGVAGYILADGFALLVAAVLLAQMADATGRPAKHAFIAQIAEGETRNRLLAFNRSIRNAGYGAGGLLAAIVLGIGTRPAYIVAIVLDVLTFVVAAILVTAIAAPPPKAVPAPKDGEPAARGGYREVLSDWRYVGLAGLNALVLLHGNAFIVGMPLWLVHHTTIPQAMVGVLFTANTVMVVLFQVRATRGLSGPADVGPVYRRAALTFALAAAAYVLAQYAGLYVAIAVMAVAVVLHSIAELSASAGEWTVSIGLAREHLRGRYLAVFALGDSATKAVGPVLVTFLITDLGSVGWIVLLVLISGGSLLSAHLTARHPRTVGPRPAEVAT